jgi:hypothetical protein
MRKGRLRRKEPTLNSAPVANKSIHPSMSASRVGRDKSKSPKVQRFRSFPYRKQIYNKVYNNGTQRAFLFFIRSMIIPGSF